MFNQTSEYALRAMVWIAGKKEGFTSAPEIAEMAQVPLDYLSKILRILGNASLLERKRGLRGGFKLKKPPDLISILDIVEIFDQIKRIEQCPLGLKGHAESLCPLHRKLDHVIREYKCQLSSTSLADLLRKDALPLCLHHKAKAFCSIEQPSLV